MNKGYGPPRGHVHREDPSRGSWKISDYPREMRSMDLLRGCKESRFASRNMRGK